MNVLAQILAALAVGILRYLQSRKDLKESIRADLEKESLSYALKAQEWRARAGVDADSLRVRSQGASLSLPDSPADVDRRTDLP
jgi:hypothetical protein